MMHTYNLIIEVEKSDVPNQPCLCMNSYNLHGIRETVTQTNKHKTTKTHYATSNQTTMGFFVERH